MTTWRLGGRLSAVLGVLWLGAAAPASAQTFGPPVSYATGGFTNGIALADVNHDSKPDLVVATCDYVVIDDLCENYHVRVRLGVGDGTFGAPADFPITEGIYPTNMPTPYGVAV